MIAVAVVAVVIGLFLRVARYVNREMWRGQRDYMLEERTGYIRAERSFIKMSKTAEKQGDAKLAAEYLAKSKEMRQAKQETETLLKDVQGYMGEPPNDAMPPDLPEPE